MRLGVLADPLAVCRLDAAAPVPEWALAAGELSAVVRTPDELSVVCAEARVPPGVPTEPGWRALAVAGPLDLDMVGVLAALAAPLAEAGISIFAVCTYETDYLLVPETKLELAVAALESGGHVVASTGRPAK
jgi:hypothetical protein